MHSLCNFQYSWPFNYEAVQEKRSVIKHLSWVPSQLYKETISNRHMQRYVWHKYIHRHFRVKSVSQKRKSREEWDTIVHWSVTYCSTSSCKWVHTFSIISTTSLCSYDFLNRNADNLFLIWQCGDQTTRWQVRLTFIC